MSPVNRFRCSRPRRSRFDRRSVQQRCPTTSLAMRLCVALGCWAFLTGCGSEFVGAQELVIKREKWEPLYQARRRPGMQELPADSPLSGLTKLNLEGALKKDPFHLGAFEIDGTFGIRNGLLTRTSGRNAAVQLVDDCGDFELEGQMNVDGLGGWFWLFGWKDGHGYTVYNPLLKTSGSPWVIGELRGAVGVESSLKEIRRHQWKGPQTLKMSVVASKLNLQVGNLAIAQDVEVSGYHPGAIIVGTYDTPYGARDVQIQSLRLRRVSVTAK